MCRPIQIDFGLELITEAEGGEVAVKVAVIGLQVGGEAVEGIIADVIGIGDAGAPMVVESVAEAGGDDVLAIIVEAGGGAGGFIAAGEGSADAD